MPGPRRKHRLHRRHDLTKSLMKHTLSIRQGNYTFANDRGVDPFKSILKYRLLSFENSLMYSVTRQSTIHFNEQPDEDLK
jgi:hypothetical protein